MIIINAFSVAICQLFSTCHICGIEKSFAVKNINETAAAKSKIFAENLANLGTVFHFLDLKTENQESPSERNERDGQKRYIWLGSEKVFNDPIDVDRTEYFLSKITVLTGLFEVYKKECGMEDFEKRMKPLPEIYECLVEAAEKIYKKTKPIAEKISKLHERIFRYKMEQLEKNIIYAINRMKNENCMGSDQNKWKRAFRLLRNARKRMIMCSTTFLTPTEIQKIDEELEDGMLKLEKLAREESLLQLNYDSKYFKYIALKKEFVETTNEIRGITEEIGRKREVKQETTSKLSNKYTELIRRNEELEGNVWTQRNEDYADSFKKIYIFERDDKELTLKKLMFQLYQGNYRLLRAVAMKETFFRAEYEISHEEDILDHFLAEFLTSNKAATSNLFS